MPTASCSKTAYAGTIEIDRTQVRSLRRGAVQAAPTGLGLPRCAGHDPCRDGAKPMRSRALQRQRPLLHHPRRLAASLPVVTVHAGQRDRRARQLRPQPRQGNTDKDEIDFDYQLEYRRGWHRFRSRGALEYDTDGNEKITDKWASFNQYSRVFPSRWYAAAWLALEHDRFADLRCGPLADPPSAICSRRARPSIWPWRQARRRCKRTSMASRIRISWARRCSCATTSSFGKIDCSPTTASSATRPWTATTSISGNPGRACGCRLPGLHRRHRIRIRLRQRPSRGGQDHGYHAAPQARL
jgi:hypothetical protein